MNQAEKFERLLCTKAVRDNLRRSSVRAAGFTGIAGAIDFVIRIGSTAVLARLLLPEQFGLVMMVTAVTAVADQFKDLGLSSATVQREDISGEEVTNLFWINVSLGVFIALLICAISPLIADYYRDPRLMPITCVLASSFIWGGLMVQHQALLTRQLKLGHTSTIRLASSFISTLLAIILAWKGFGYWALVWREVVRSALIAAGMWICFPWIPGLPSRKTKVWGLVHFGTNMTAAYILASVCSSVDRVLIGRFSGAGPVAMYRQAFQLIVTPMEQLFSPINQVAQPGLCMLQADAARFRRFFRKITVTVSIATMPVSLFVAVNYAEITGIVLGRKWVDAGEILMILSLGSFVKWSVMPSAVVLLTRGRSRAFLILMGVTSIVTVLFMCIGVKWGAIGVAVADVAATYSLIAPRLYYSFQDSPVTITAFFSAVVRPAVASIAMAAVLLVARAALPGLPALSSLALSAAAAPVLFLGALLLIPGGKAELLELMVDVRSALQKKISRVSVTESTSTTT